MFAIAAEQRQYKTYILSDQVAKSQLEVVPERGGIITRWQLQGQEILYLDAERFANPELTVRGGVPILFPICGNLPDNIYTYNGKQYSLKQHGFARNLPWQVTNQVTQDVVSLTLVLNSNDETLAVYPFEFQVAFTYQLTGNSLTIHQRYSNRSAEPMPFSTGLHPYFLTADKSKLEFEIPATQYVDHLTYTTHAFHGHFDWTKDEIDVAFRPVLRQSATVKDLGRNLKLTLGYDEVYSTLVFWSVKDKNFYCLEPWTAGRNALNTGDRLTYLEPGADLETRITFTIEFL